MKNFFQSVFILALTAATGTPLFAQNWFGSGINGKGPKVTQTLDISSFDGLSLSINADVYIRQGNTQSVKIEAQQNMIDNLKREVSNGNWRIGFEQNVREHEGITIWITIPNLKRATVSGSGDIKGEGSFRNLKDLEVAVSGSGSVSLDADASEVDASVSGSGDIRLDGSASSLDVRISGSGDVVSFGMATKNCSVKISGSGDASVQASDSLDVAIAGSGDVFYKGKPRVKSKIVGSGDVVER